ncbi:acyltransferase [Gluconacetobacter azotocaptans]|uniref:Acyltransferase n=1 Tax=Gluconacetobacter azotocaptans TaxID=142834 RepID=A0A7W4JQC9_9PROT|nr:acyltransferase [Gluconacetobacter azotocaptans]MBB2188966.1 acyltransferase [Gluconacetobacter azotocaptans]GBQ25884.1 lipopolysaccharide modification acyltransferase [Gluconacetobacter azotocaptans DSM 13594]
MPHVLSGTDRPPGRNPGIDLIRGVSIVLVVVHHMALRIPLPKTGLATVFPRQLLMALGFSGYEAVFVFFVISGFLITENAIRRWGSVARIDLRAFYGRRFARIAPCLVVLIVILSLLDLTRVPDYVIVHAGQSLPRAILSALGMHLNWYEGRTGYLPGGWDVLWSLSVEEAFYLGFPLACLLVGRHAGVRAVFFGVLALSLPLALNALSDAPEVWREKAYLPGMAAIAMGVCAALFAATVRAPRKGLTALSGACGAILLFSILLDEPFFLRLMGNATMLILTGSVALLLLAFHWGWGRRRAARGTAWLRSCGVMSYEIYLTHMFVVFPLVGLFHWSGSALRFGWLWFTPALCLSWGLGWVVDRVLSSPADRWVRARLKAAAPVPA